VDRAGGEVEDVEDDEGEQHQSGPGHGAGGPGGFLQLLGPVAQRPRLAVLEIQGDGGPGVEPHRREHHQAEHPDALAVDQALEQLGVVVEGLNAHIGLHVAEHVHGDEAEQDEAGDGHDDLLAHRGVQKAGTGGGGTGQADFNCRHWHSFLGHERTHDIRVGEDSFRLSRDVWLSFAPYQHHVQKL